MDYEGYSSQAIEVALDLLNTRGTEEFPDELPDVDAFVAFLHRHGFPVDGDRPNESELAALKQVREDLVVVFQTDDLAVAAAAVNSVLDRTRARPQLVNHDESGWHLHFEARDGGWANRVGAVAAGALATVLLEAGLTRFGECADAGCETFYVDASKNASRRYCCERCSTRAAVAAHRERKRAARQRS